MDTRKFVNPKDNELNRSDKLATEKRSAIIALALSDYVTLHFKVELRTRTLPYLNFWLSADRR